MSEALIRSISDLLRSSVVTWTDASRLILQLFAWDKLNRSSEKKEIPELAEVINGFETRRKIGDGLRALQRYRALGNNQAAFDYSDGVLQMLSDRDLQHVVRFIEGARSQKLNYREIIQACSLTERGGEGYSATPNEVADLCVRLAGISSTDTVYCPFDNSLKLAERSNDITRNVFFEGRVITPLPYLINILEEGSISVKQGDPVREPSWVEDRKLMQFDVALADIPFGVRYRHGEIVDIFRRFPESTLYGEVLSIQHVLAQTKRKAVVIVPNGLLFRTAAGERQFKEHILDSGILEAVIGLPTSLLTTTSIGFSLLVLNKKGTPGKVLFIDASSEHFFDQKKGRSFDGGRRTLKNLDEIFRLFKQGTDSEFSYIATLDECRANDYNLLPERYVTTKEQARIEEILRRNKTVVLEEISEVLRPQSLKTEIEEGGIEFYEVSVSDIGEDGYIHQPKKTLLLSEKGFEKIRPLALRPHDILLAVKGSVGKVGLVPPNFHNTWIANQSFQVIRIKPNRQLNDPTVLFRYLCSPIGQSLLQARVGGTTVPMVQTRDVKGLPIAVPSLEEQKLISKDHHAIVEIYERIALLRGQAEEITARHWTI